VKFKETQALKRRAYAAFAAGTTLTVPVTEAAKLDPISLAFVGDAYYALYTRRSLVSTGIPNVQVLHALASEFVSARVQAIVYHELKDMLDPVEQEVCRRARNAYSQAPKSATVGEYHDSTALEALIGYLVLSGQEQRLEDIMAAVLSETRTYCHSVHGEQEKQ